MKKTVLILILLSLSLISCSTDDPTNTYPSTTNGPLVKQINEIYESENNSDVLRTIDHTYSGNKLVKVVDEFHSPNGSKLTSNYTYAGGQLTDILETVDNGTNIENYTTELSYDSSGRLNEIIKNGTSRFTYTYQSNGVITRTSINSNNTVNMTYSGENITNISFVDGTTGDTVIREVTFDDKNYFLKNIHQYDIFALLNYNGGINNDIQVTLDSGFGSEILYDRSYTYNPNNYPITMTTVQAAGTSTESTSTATFTYY